MYTMVTIVNNPVLYDKNLLVGQNWNILTKEKVNIWGDGYIK